jgi:hypothetical protein
MAQATQLPGDEVPDPPERCRYAEYPSEQYLKNQTTGRRIDVHGALNSGGVALPMAQLNSKYSDQRILAHDRCLQVSAAVTS